MAVWKCNVCGHIYDYEKEFIPFEDLDDTYLCTVCGVPKSEFTKVE